MPINGTFVVSGSVQGRSYSNSEVISTDAALQFDETCEAGQAGSLTTRTNNTDGEITMNSNSHTVATADVVDLYWDTGNRRGVVVGTVSGTAVPISGGTGDNLPTANTAISVGATNIVNTSIVGNNVESIVVDGAGDADAQWSLLSGGVEIVGGVLTAGSDYVWWNGSGITNPVASNTIAQVRISQNGSANAAVRGSIQYST